MSTEENKEIVHRWIEARNANDLDGALTLWADEWQKPVRSGFQLFSNAFSDISIKVDDIFCEGNKVGLRWTMNATHHGVYQGIPATEKKITMLGIDIYTIENGKIKSIVRRTDDLSLLKQMGVTLSWQGDVIT
jgi:steroid delta-isomerase-like uncharacterized protein